MRKRIFAIVICLLTAITMMPVPTFADVDPGQTDDSIAVMEGEDGIAALDAGDENVLDEGEGETPEQEQELIDLSGAEVILDVDSFIYNGTAPHPVVIVSLDGTTLSEGDDYMLTYDESAEVGMHSVVVTGTGDYTGTVSASYTIGKKPQTVSVTTKYSKTILDEDFTLDAATDGDGKLTYGSDNTAVVTVSSTGVVAIRGLGTAHITVYARETEAYQQSESVTVTIEVGKVKPSITATTSYNKSVVDAPFQLDASTDSDGELLFYSNNPEVATVGSDGLVTIKSAGTAVIDVSTGETDTYCSAETKKCTVTVKPQAISAATLGTVSNRTYRGTSFKPTPAVTVDGTKLTAGTDFTYSYANNLRAGIATITITGKGNYSGKRTIDFQIYRKGIKDAQVTGYGGYGYIYNGAAKKPEPKVVVSLEGTNTTLKKGTDYTLSYKNNVKAGTATVTITGKGNYQGTVSRTYTIAKKSITGASVTNYGNKGYVYNGVAKKPAPTVKIKLNGTTKTLTRGTDYTVTYKNNIKAGTATLTITGKGNFKGTITRTYTIAKKSITSASVTNYANKGYVYNGVAKKPAQTVKIKINGTTRTLKKGTDYTVTYKNNVKAGTATLTITGKGNYKGTMSRTFTISKRSLSGASVSSISSKGYTGNSIKPTPTVKIKVNGTTKTLVRGTDYTLSYKNNVKPGTATVTITGKGNYKGTLTKTFKIYKSDTYYEELYLGYWDAYAVSYDGVYMTTSEMGMTNSMYVYDDYTLYVYTNGESDGYGDWWVEDSYLIVDDGVSEIYGWLSNGHLIMDFGDGFYIYYK